MVRWLATRPAAMTRSSRRISRAGLFALETFTRRAPGDELTPEARARRLRWIAENLCAMHAIHVVTRGPRPMGPCVLVGNHLTYIDPLAVLCTVPCCAVAKREVGHWPVLGEAMRDLGVLFVDRACPESGARTLLRARAALRADVPVLAFPEGTTTTGGDVLPFRRGLFGLASLLDVPIVPITLRYDSHDLAWVGDEGFLPHYLRTTTRANIRVRVQFHEAMAPRGRGAEDLAESARRMVRSGLFDA